MKIRNLLKKYKENKNIFLILKLVVTIFIFLFILNKIDIYSIKEILLNSKINYLTLAFLFKILGIFFSSLVLYYCLVIFNKGNKLKTFSIYLSSYFFNNLGLGSLGSDSYKWIRLNKSLNSKSITTLTLISEKILGFSILFSLLICSIIFLFIYKSIFLYFLLPIPLAIIIIFSSSILLNSILFRKSSFIGLNIQKLIDRENRFFLIKSLFYSFLFYLSNIFAFLVIIYALNYKIPLYVAFFIIPIVIFVNTIPISFNGLGIREVSISYLFLFLGYDFNIGLASALLLLFLNILISILSGIYYLKNVLLLNK